MTHDPSLPTIEEVMNGSPFDIVDSPWGHIERWRASTLATGTMGALAQVYEMVRSDAADAAARADETQAREALVQHLCDVVAGLQERVNRLADALEARHKADAEREEREAAEREFEQEPLSLPPGDPPSAASIGDATMSKISAREIIARDETHTPTGDLHDLPPKDEGELPEPPLSTADVELHPEDPALEDPLEEPVPTSPKGGVIAPPIDVSLNEK